MVSPIHIHIHIIIVTYIYIYIYTEDDGSLDSKRVHCSSDQGSFKQPVLVL